MVLASNNPPANLIHTGVTFRPLSSRMNELFFFDFLLPNGSNNSPFFYNSTLFRSFNEEDVIVFYEFNKFSFRFVGTLLVSRL